MKRPTLFIFFILTLLGTAYQVKFGSAPTAQAAQEPVVPAFITGLTTAQDESQAALEFTVAPTPATQVAVGETTQASIAELTGNGRGASTGLGWTPLQHVPSNYTYQFEELPAETRQLINNLALLLVIIGSFCLLEINRSVESIFSSFEGLFDDLLETDVSPNWQPELSETYE